MTPKEKSAEILRLLLEYGRRLQEEGGSMDAAKPANPPETESDGHLPARDWSSIDDVFAREAYSLLSAYEGGIRKGNGELLIRPSEVRLTLSKIRVSKPVIRRILGNMERQGLVKQGNQFILVKRK